MLQFSELARKKFPSSKAVLESVRNFCDANGMKIVSGLVQIMKYLQSDQVYGEQLKAAPWLLGSRVWGSAVFDVVIEESTGEIYEIYSVGVMIVAYWNKIAPSKKVYDIVMYDI